MEAGVPSDFFVGLNYPWVRYGQDFGRSPWGVNGVATPATRQEVTSDFERIRATGVTVVRWFLLCDGRSGLNVSGGIPAGPDEFLFADVAAALSIAGQFGLRLCFPLIDFLWMQNPGALAAEAPPAPALPNQNVMKFAAGREALLERVLIPLFKEFRTHPALFAWEIANEPEWAIPEFSPGPRAGISLADFRAFAKEVADAIHEFAAVPATLGSARLQWVRAWSEIGLDLYQAHYYPQAERDEKTSLSGQLAALRDLDRPLWLGEIPPRDPKAPEYSCNAAVETCRSSQLAGASVWRWRPPEEGGSDSDLGFVDASFFTALNAKSTGTSA